MSQGTYRVPPELPRPAKVGDVMETMDNGPGRRWPEPNVMEVVTVKKATKASFVTSCGRRWKQGTGYWVGSGRAWPYPCIRFKEAD